MARLRELIELTSSLGLLDVEDTSPNEDWNEHSDPSSGGIRSDIMGVKLVAFAVLLMAFTDWPLGWIGAG